MLGAVRTTIVGVAVGLTLITGCAAGQPGTPLAVPSSAPSPTPSEAPSKAPETSRVPVATRVPVKPAPVTTKPAPPKKKAPDEDSNAVIGPMGWQTLLLTMTPAEAAALGIATPADEGDDLCQVWPASGLTPLERVIVHPVHGVFAIHPKPVDWLHTPEGMHVGWTAAEVAAAYPDFNPAHMDYAHGPTVAVPGNPNAVYRMEFTPAGVLARFLLERDSDICST